VRAGRRDEARAVQITDHVQRRHGARRARGGAAAQRQRGRSGCVSLARTLFGGGGSWIPPPGAAAKREPFVESAIQERGRRGRARDRYWPRM
jgi:hypothetical protein